MNLADIFEILSRLTVSKLVSKKSAGPRPFFM
jgi:hypothetical protein